MTEFEIHRWVMGAIVASGAMTILALAMTTAPYGRYARDGWGAMMPSRWAWILMESPAVLLFGGIYAVGSHAWEPASLTLCALWMLHYVDRAFVYPVRMYPRGSDRRVPVSVPAMAIGFNTANAYVNARWISELGDYSEQWMTSPQLWLGAAVMVVGIAVNRVADERLRALRRANPGAYSIPYGWLYRWVSCPNYLGELVIWTGWACATWSLAGLSFLWFTGANLVPRAWSNHRWYRDTFPDYPRDRRAIVPFVF